MTVSNNLFLQALDVCIDKHIPISEEMAESMSPDKDAEQEYR